MGSRAAVGPGGISGGLMEGGPRLGSPVTATSAGAGGSKSEWPGPVLPTVATPSVGGGVPCVDGWSGRAAALGAVLLPPLAQLGLADMLLPSGGVGGVGASDGAAIG